MTVSVTLSKLSDRAYAYTQLMRLDRPIGIFLLLWPVMWALWIAGDGHPDPGIVFIFILGVVLMRSAGCVINDFADRHFDPHVQRTRHRPLAAGRVTPREALGLFAALGLTAFILVLFLNGLTILLSFVAILLAITYPFMKRYTHLPQIYLGLVFGWAVPMAFAAQTGGVPKIAWLLLLATVLWATAYDTMYAMVDRRDDMRIGVKSTAILFGESDRLMIGFIQGLFFVVLVVIGEQLDMGLWYYLGLCVAAGFAVYHQYMIRDRDVQQCFRAFLSNNWLGAAVFGGIVLDYLGR